MERDSIKSRAGWDKAWDIINDVLNEKRPFTELVEFAAKAANIHKGMVAAESHMETNRLILGKLIYSDAKELKKYMEKSMPQMMIEKK
jgi:hypothetical protein